MAKIKREYSKNIRRKSALRIKRLAAIGSPIKIPEVVIKRLKPFGPHFLKVSKSIPGNNKSGKRAVEHAWQERPYEDDSKELQHWVKEGNNYGVMAGQGITIIDLDRKDLAEKFEAEIDTFTVQTGRVNGEGRHYYLRSDATENGLLVEEGENVGNIQVINKFVVGPGCHHNSGGVYRIIKDVPLAWISKQQLKQIFGDSLKWTGEVRERHKEEAEDEKKRTNLEIPMALLVDLSEMDCRGDEYQGGHPLHGSTTGQNFCVNIKENVWHCFRCNSGGGGLMWIAVKHGVLECHEAQKGALRGLKFIEAVKFAQEEGFQIKVPDEEISPDVERFFEGKPPKFVSAYVAKEIMEETKFLTEGERGLIFRYNTEKGIYESNGEDYIMAQTAKKLGKHYSIRRKAEIQNFIRASTIREIPETSKYLLAVKNGVLDVRTLELKPFSPEYYIFNALPLVYDSEAECPQFNKFLLEVVPSEKDRLVLQEHGGYCLLKDNRFQKALMLTGKKQNGKSTFLNTLTAMLGKENVSAIPLQILSDSRFRFYVSQLHNKMANICADLPAERLKETDMFKKIVAGDMVTGEFKFHPPFDFKPYTKLLYSANQLPQLPKDVEAFLVRWSMVEFPNTFLPGDPKRDPQLIEKLTKPEELSGILNWCLEGLQRLLKQKGFTVGNTLEEQEDRWIVEGDSVKAFYERCIREQIGEYAEKGKVYDAYIQFCDKHKVKPLTRGRFTREFRETSKADSGSTSDTDGKTIRVWWHISVKDED
jgi:P4 family phage/plasmid primase-like protien